MARIFKVGGDPPHTPLSFARAYLCVSKRYAFLCQDSSSQHKRTDLQTELGNNVIFLKRKSHSNISIVIRAIPRLTVLKTFYFAFSFHGTFWHLS